MRFYQKIRFRLIAGSALLVSAVAVLLTLYIQRQSKRVLRKHEFGRLFQETTLRFHAVSAEIDTLRADLVGLASGSLRLFQWAEYFLEKRTQYEPPGDPKEFRDQKADETITAFKKLLAPGSRYLRIEYYHNCKNLAAGPRLSRSRKDFDGQPRHLLDARDGMIQRAKGNPGEPAFSPVRIHEGKDGSRWAFMQACLPIRSGVDREQCGLVVVTVDFTHWARALARSPRTLVFLADQSRLLLCPQMGRPADYVLNPEEADTEHLRATVDWLRKWAGETDLEEDASVASMPVRDNTDPPPTGPQDGEVPANLEFFLLRCRITDSLREDPKKCAELTTTLRELRKNHKLALNAGGKRATDELLIRGWPSEEQSLRDIRANLAKKYGSGLKFLDRRPLRCTNFVYTRYKFSFAPRSSRKTPAPAVRKGNLPEQCFYVAMASPIEAIDAPINDNNFRILLVVLCCVLGAVGLAVLGSILVTRRLNAITAATEQLAIGNEDVALPVRDPTEIGVLARSFAFMIGQIQERRREAEEAARRRNEELEQAVKERTGELESANIELALARDKAEHVSVAKDFFLATVSHELRTPLNHVLGFIQLLELTQLDEDQQRDLNKIGSAANNLLGLVNDLLDYQKIVQGVLTLEPTSIDLVAWTADLAEAMRPKVAEKGNRLVVNCPLDIGELEADEKRVRQALTNLLSNAGKFTRNGTVALRVRREREGANEWMRLDVHDTGLGLTPAQQTRLFQPFTRLLSRTENPEGTGLGLALSQKLCRLMGGDLVLSHSEPGQGSTFTIRLPATAAAAGQTRPVPPTRPASSPDLPGSSQGPTCVLVIDDDPDVRELMRRHLQEHGFVVHLAASGAEGLEMVKRLRPDAITLDVLMPGIDGWGTLAALQADAETAQIPVILITMLDDRTRGFALGAWEVLPKPISWSRLIDLLRHIEPNTGPVLLVDDDPAFRELAGRMLSQHGWEACCVEDARSALAAAARRCPVLVVLDLLMPGMDGFAFLEAFRQDSTWREVPVVVLTAKDLTEEDRRRLDGSVQRILPKGMSSMADVLQEIEWLLHHPTNGESQEPTPPESFVPAENPTRGGADDEDSGGRG